MAKIRLKFNSNEIEIDSRDFYLDNKTVGEVIENLSKFMNTNEASVSSDDSNTEPIQSNALDSLEDAEVFEPEFNEPQLIELDEIESKLRILDANRFFDTPKTVTETVRQLQELGWIARSLDVSKSLAKMASSRSLVKNFDENRIYYSTRNPLLSA